MEEIEKYVDETGYLSRERKYQYLVDKGIIRLDNKNEPIIRFGKGTEYLRAIEDIETHFKHRKKGKMGVIDTIEAETKINKLDEETITADEIDLGD